MKMSQKEINAIMSIAAKIIKHQEAERTKKEINTIIRDSEDEHDKTGQPRPGNCGCHNEE